MYYRMFGVYPYTQYNPLRYKTRKYSDGHGRYCLNLLSLLGYLRTTDFGIARFWKKDNAKDTSGTPGYMAPEVMLR
jgi:serine/threonine protein kinase